MLGEIVRVACSKRRSGTSLARVGGDVPLAGWRVRPPSALIPAVPSGRKWQGSQSSEGATELVFPRPALGQMQSEAARRAGEPSGEGEEPPPQGLVVTIRSPRPMRAVQRARLCAITWTASQAALAAKRPEGR